MPSACAMALVLLGVAGAASAQQAGAVAPNARAQRLSSLAAASAATPITAASPDQSAANANLQQAAPPPPPPQARNPRLPVQPNRMRAHIEPPKPAAPSTLPPTPQTTLPPAAPVGTVTASALAPVSRARRAAVTYEGNELTIVAEDSSLNQILRSVEKVTGMKITGGVPEQRVFGRYGPANPAQLLTTLLDGTNTNVLIRETADKRPTEMILTARNGGPTPPNPNAPGYDDPPEPAPAPVQRFGAPAFRANAAPNQPAPATAAPASPVPAAQVQAPAAVPSTGSLPSVPPPLNNVLGNPNNRTPSASELPTTNSQPIDSLPTPSTTVQTTQGIVDTANPPPPNQNNPLAPPQPIVPPSNPNVSNTTTPDPGTTSTTTVNPPVTDYNPNNTTPAATTPASPAPAGAKTPEQIMQELQQLQQQKQQAPAPQ